MSNDLTTDQHEAAWAALAKLGRLVHSVQLIEATSTPQELRGRLLGELPTMRDGAVEACLQYAAAVVKT